MADSIVRSGQVPELRDSDVTKAGKTIWYFSHIPNRTQCFEHTVRRTGSDIDHELEHERELVEGEEVLPGGKLDEDKAGDPVGTVEAGAVFHSDLQCDFALHSQHLRSVRIISMSILSAL